MQILYHEAYIVDRRVHVKMAADMETIVDGDLVDTAFNDILLDYLKKGCPGLAEMVGNKLLL